ncbi:hypothetical protein A8O14_10230 [Polynucleobacter wuianus]|uniref:Uncharacterized protein n=1 Tax=Polynucleobacter wuianus TaxID=1743168 RepID=A0A191UHM7_9BURK|nr:MULTISPECIES: hypothetical protein [Polynucleobacter]ANJ00417.1 hypothetical protein A8O14_10230 [Polynucleobacter wuianus]MBU3552997.1 hypothetical protein [Polynucleobacter sp. MWH-Post4-6-1]
MATTKQFIPSIQNNVFAKKIIQSLNKLSELRQEWEQTTYKKATDGLYSLLTHCFKTYDSNFVNATDADRKTLRLELMNRLKKERIKVVPSTTTLTMLIRFVFQSDRKRAHVYGYAIKAAISHGVTPDNFTHWLITNHGIEEVKAELKESDETKKKKAAFKEAKDLVDADIEEKTANPIMQFALKGIKGTHGILLVKATPDGEVGVVGVVTDPKESLVKAVVKQMAQEKTADMAVDKAVSNESHDLLAQMKKEAANHPQLRKAA